MPEAIFSIYHRWLQYDPINQDLANRQRQTVLEIAGRERTGAGALKIGASALNLVEGLIGKHEAARPLPKPIVCRAGCPVCCSNQVELLPPEALLLGDYVKRHFSPGEQQALLAGIARNLEIRAGKSTEELAFIRPQLLCPLLREGSCSVYPARTLFCRTHHSLDVTPCQREYRGEKVTEFEFYSHRYEIMLSVRTGLLEGCRALGCQAKVLDHMEALQICLANDHAAERWINGETVF